MSIQKEMTTLDLIKPMPHPLPFGPWTSASVGPSEAAAILAVPLELLNLKHHARGSHSTCSHPHRPLSAIHSPTNQGMLCGSWPLSIYSHLTYLYYMLCAQMSCFPSITVRDLMLLSVTLHGSPLRRFFFDLAKVRLVLLPLYPLLTRNILFAIK